MKTIWASVQFTSISDSQDCMSLLQHKTIIINFVVFLTILQLSAKCMKIKVYGLEHDNANPVFIAFSCREPNTFRAHVALKAHQTTMLKVCFLSFDIFHKSWIVQVRYASSGHYSSVADTLLQDKYGNKQNCNGFTRDLMQKTG